MVAISTVSPASALPLVLIPGLACSPRLFTWQLPVLWQHGPVTIAQTNGGASIASMATHILRSAPSHFVLLGLSMGGYLAFEILRQAPERVLALALLNTSARPDTQEAQENRLRMIELAQQGKLQLASELNFPRSVHPSRVDDTSLRSIVRHMADETGVPTYIAQQQAIMARPDSRPLLPHITCPSLVLVGAQDQLTPPDRAEEMAAAIPGAALHIVPVCGHLSTLEEPQQVNRILKAWLHEVAAQTPQKYPSI